MNIRRAKLKDCEALLQLNWKYYEAFKNGDKEKGFLRNQFSLFQMQALVGQDEVVVAEDQETIIGYYLTNSLFETDVIQKRKTLVEELIQSGQISKARYAYLTQAAVDRPFMGMGVAKEMLKNLKELVSIKFDFLIGFIDYENHNAKEAHLKSGWKIFAETENGWLAMTDVNEL